MVTAGGTDGKGTGLSVDDDQHAHRIEVAERRLRVLFESPMIGLIFWNRSGAITEANDAFLDLIGYSRDDLVSGRVDWIAP